MNTFRDITETFIPGAMGFGVITIGDLNALASLLVALVSIVCTILVTVHKLRTK
jgi:hypothetical protein